MEKIIGLIDAPFTPFYDNGYVNYDLAPQDMEDAVRKFEDLRVPSNLDNTSRAKKNKDIYTFIANSDFNKEYPYDKPYGFMNVKFIKKSNGETETLQLVPVGSTILRKLSFTEEKFY